MLTATSSQVLSGSFSICLHLFKSALPNVSVLELCVDFLARQFKRFLVASKVDFNLKGIMGTGLDHMESTW